MKRCSKCKRELELSAFSRDAQKRDGLRPNCKECHRADRVAYTQANREAKRAYDREYYERNADRIKRRAAEWREQNPDRVAADHARMKQRYQKSNRGRYADYAENRRARLVSQWVEHVDRNVVFDRDGGVCHICQKAIRSVGDAHIDHLNPISAGGEHSYANVAIAHASCNIKRGAGRIPAQLRLVG